MDIEGDHATLKCHHAPCGLVALQENLKDTRGQEHLRAVGITFDFDIPVILLHSD
jgi:hypothetical protein